MSDLSTSDLGPRTSGETISASFEAGSISTACATDNIFPGFVIYFRYAFLPAENLECAAPAIRSGIRSGFAGRSRCPAPACAACRRFRGEDCRRRRAAHQPRPYAASARPGSAPDRRRLCCPGAARRRSARMICDDLVRRKVQRDAHRFAARQRDRAFVLRNRPLGVFGVERVRHGDGDAGRHDRL